MNLRNHIPKIILLLIILGSAGLMIGAAISDSPAIGESNGMIGDLYIARGLAILSAVVFLVLLYLGSAKLLGTRWALLPTFILAFSPSFLAYGHYFNFEFLNIFTLFIFGYVFVKILMNIKTLIRTKNYRNLSIYAAAAFLFIALFYFHGGTSFSGASNNSNWIELGLNYSLRETLSILTLISIAFIFAIKNIVRKIPDARNGIASYFVVNPAEFSIIILLPIYVLFIAMQSKVQIINILPILPLIYILTSSGIKNLVSTGGGKRIKLVVIIVLATCHALNTLMIYPYYAIYANEIARTSKTLEYWIAERSDIGVDLKRLNNWLNENPGKMGLDYFGDVNPVEYLGNKYIEWRSSYNEPAEVKLDYIAISFKKIHEAKRELLIGETRNAEDEYLWLPNIFSPDAKVGAIWIYKLAPDPSEISEF